MWRVPAVVACPVRPFHIVTLRSEVAKHQAAAAKDSSPRTNFIVVVFIVLDVGGSSFNDSLMQQGLAHYWTHALHSSTSKQQKFESKQLVFGVVSDRPNNGSVVNTLTSESKTRRPVIPTILR